MVSFASLSVVALMIASGVIAAPWQAQVRHAVTHRTRAVGPTGVDLSSYHPRSVYEAYGVDGVDYSLAKRGIKRATPEEVAKSFLQDKLGVASDALLRHAGHTSDIASYEYFTQMINGIQVANAVANVVVKDDKVMSYGASFVTPKNVAVKEPKLEAAKAIDLAEQATGGKYNLWPTTLAYIAKDNGDVVLTYGVQTQGTKDSSWKLVYIDALTGDVANVVNFVADASYRAVPLNYQDPTEQYRVITDPQDIRASPKGWHATSKVSTEETSGNNAVSYKGVDGNPMGVSTGIPIVDRMLGTKVAQTSHQSSPTNNYDYPFDPSKPPQVDPNVDAARVNTFYTVNSMHDLTYKFGFTEDAFNFQEDNYRKGGKQGDRVQVSVQDASGTNNANFATPPDGQHGQMRMFTWTYTNPQRDGALENDIVVHEFTHGVSNRLTGGGTGACLQTNEAGGMGEGWSDAMADITEAKSKPIPDYVLGKYVVNKPGGIRSHPYSTDMTVNPLTYGSLATKSEVHDIGEVWANMLHGVFGALVDMNGISETLDPASESGNSVMLHLLMDGLKGQPCNPTFVSARNAIISADACRYGGKYNCTIWKAFAKRGLGQNAVAGTYADNMDIPGECK